MSPCEVGNLRTGSLRAVRELLSRSVDGPGSSLAETRLRVTHVITDLNPGGAELVLLRLVAETIDRCAHSILVVSGWDPLRFEFERLGCSVTVIGIGRRSPNPLKILRLVVKLRASNPNVIQTWLPAADLLGGLAGRIATDAPVAWNIRHSELFPSSHSRATRLVVRFGSALSRYVPSAIVAVGHHAARVHTAIGYEAKRIKVIHNGFSLPAPMQRSQARAQLGLPFDALVVSRIGRYHPDKDHEGLLRIWISVTTREPLALLVLAGRDCDETNGELRALLERLGLRSVLLLGHLPDPGPLYASSDLVVSNSLSEGFPNVVGEAMSYGVPTVVTDVGDCRSLVGDAGRVVPFGLAVSDLLSDPIAREDLGRRARQRIAEHFALDAMADKYFELWRCLASVRS
jgi:glycosyltransferase involved in cell wall biosynthesis